MYMSCVLLCRAELDAAEIAKEEQTMTQRLEAAEQEAEAAKCRAEDLGIRQGTNSVPKP